jgi:hypothetical protein
LKLLTNNKNIPISITTNYDTLTSLGVIALQQELNHEGNRIFVDSSNHGIPIEIPYKEKGFYIEIKQEERPVILKLNGSLSWFYCPACDQISNRFTNLAKAQLTEISIPDEYLVEKLYFSKKNLCSRCKKASYEAIMKAPSSEKTLFSNHIINLFDQAKDAISSAKKMFFIGYSLPSYDLDILYLIKRSIALNRHLDDGKNVFVIDNINPLNGSDQNYYKKRINCLKDSTVYKRYQSILPNNFNWYSFGLLSYIGELERSKGDPTKVEYAS